MGSGCEQLNDLHGAPVTLVELVASGTVITNLKGLEDTHIEKVGACVVCVCSFTHVQRLVFKRDPVCTTHTHTRTHTHTHTHTAEAIK